MTPDRAIETAADYADAMMTARSAKNVLVLALLLMLLAQLAIFFIARYKPSWIESTISISTTTSSRTLTRRRAKTRLALEYATAAIDFLGIAFSIVLSLVLLTARDGDAGRALHRRLRDSQPRSSGASCWSCCCSRGRHFVERRLQDPRRSVHVGRTVANARASRWTRPATPRWRSSS